jgi:hypothetical protein
MSRFGFKSNLLFLFFNTSSVDKMGMLLTALTREFNPGYSFSQGAQI